MTEICNHIYVGPGVCVLCGAHQPTKEQPWDGLTPEEAGRCDAHEAMQLAITSVKIAELQSALRFKEEECERLKGALRPFAAFTPPMTVPDSWTLVLAGEAPEDACSEEVVLDEPSAPLKAGDFRRAAAAIEGSRS